MKTVIFDFDGTLTKKDQNIWKMLWKELGYSTDKTSLYAELYTEHVVKNSINREEWFDLTCYAFKQKEMDKQTLVNVTRQIELINGFNETIKTLHDNGYSLYILSGGIRQTIYMLLGENAKYFTYIESNDAIFNSQGKLIKLRPTPYDYEGKAYYIEKLKNRTHTSANEIIYVGNGDNDEWAHLSGCKTICINPQNTESKNKTKWHICKESVNNLTEILDCFNIKQTSQNEINSIKNNYYF